MSLFNKMFSRSVLSSKPSTMSDSSAGHVIAPISSITPYQNKWTIKVCKTIGPTMVSESCRFLLVFHFCSLETSTTWNIFLDKKIVFRIFSPFISSMLLLEYWPHSYIISSSYLSIGWIFSSIILIEYHVPSPNPVWGQLNYLQLSFPLAYTVLYYRLVWPLNLTSEPGTRRVVQANYSGTASTFNLIFYFVV